MVQSQQVLEWMAQGEAKALLRMLEKRFPPSIPADLVAAIQATTDQELLLRWIDVALASPTLEAFRQAMHS